MNFQTEPVYRVALSEEQLDRLRCAVQKLYQQIEQQHIDSSVYSCRGCGQCCDFQSYGHRLFLTPPELIYLDDTQQGLFLPMTNGICPYRINGRCSVYTRRFVGCRIFFCQGNQDYQHNLGEILLKELKKICIDFGLTYQYWDLQCALAKKLEYGLPHQTE